MRSESIAHRGLSHDLELAISRHFIEKYYGLLLLPNSHPDFYDGWITEIQYLMVDHKSLRYSVLANGASNLHLMEKNDSMQELALTYYSNALQGLTKLLINEGQLANHNGLLMSVMLLFIHGCMGQGTYSDTPQHVSAATRILSMRLFSSESSIKRPFDRLAVESVLYQIFLITTGLWSEDIPLDYQFDLEFWLKAERLLNRSIIFPDGSNSLNSPVLGVPVSLYRLALSMKQQFQDAREGTHNPLVLANIKSEVEQWEALVLCDGILDHQSINEQFTRTHEFYRDASYLFILNISLLLEQTKYFIRKSPSITGTGPPEMAPSSSWQVSKALSILYARRHDKEWKMCFMGNWPVYTLGFFLSSVEDVQLLRTEMNDRWRLSRFSQLTRFIGDLESVWSKRGFAQSRNE